MYSLGIHKKFKVVTFEMIETTKMLSIDQLRLCLTVCMGSSTIFYINITLISCEYHRNV